MDKKVYFPQVYFSMTADRAFLFRERTPAYRGGSFLLL